MKAELVALSHKAYDCADCHGACCKRVDIETREIHRCQYLTDDDLCSIYEDRPIACRLDSRFCSDYFKQVHCQLNKASVELLIPMTELSASKHIQEGLKSGANTLTD